MPLARFVLLLIVVIAAAAITVALGVLVAASMELPGIGLMVTIPVALVAYVLVRVVRDRVKSREDGHYDRIER